MVLKPAGRKSPTLISAWIALAACAISRPGFAAPAFEDSESGAKSEIQFRLEPHLYSGSRGTEPKFQTVAQTSLRFRSTTQDRTQSQWTLQLHAESELDGRRDRSFDLDRAWYSWATGSMELTLGRIHPWDISGNLEANRPWGYAQQLQPQNRGILLGQGFLGSNDEVFPQPVLLGWLGVHTWSSPSRKGRFQWGLSATPFFIPNLGSEVSFSTTEDASAGRFGRRPPGTIDVGGGNLLPLRYRLDDSRIFQDVILNPQLGLNMRAEITSELTGHYSFQYSPSAEADPTTSGFVSVSGSGVNAIAEVTPRFPKSLIGTLTHVWKPSRLLGNTKFFLTVAGNTLGRVGFETGMSFKSVTITYLTERPQPSSGGSASSAGGSYTNQMVQMDVALNLTPRWGLFGGFKVDPVEHDSWVRLVSKHPISARAQLDFGAEAFAGSEGTYFSEWRTNDRIYVAFTWRLES
ncbi:MAG: hypothetical protein JNL01_05690 [Bdellovibrionales bacterium]|nr:hypothetical protein [Bdellovibrionales bacterium]